MGKWADGQMDKVKTEAWDVLELEQIGALGEEGKGIWGGGGIRTPTTGGGAGDSFWLLVQVDLLRALVWSSLARLRRKLGIWCLVWSVVTCAAECSAEC